MALSPTILDHYQYKIILVNVMNVQETNPLTHWGRVKHICVSRLTITGSDNGLSPGRRQAIIWTNAGILLIGSLGTNFGENLIEILTFSFTKMRLKLSSAKWRSFCLGLNVLTECENNTYEIYNILQYQRRSCGITVKYKWYLRFYVRLDWYGCSAH